MIILVSTDYIYMYLVTLSRASNEDFYFPPYLFAPSGVSCPYWSSQIGLFDQRGTHRTPYPDDFSETREECSQE
jgi:hypothetical protein